MAESSWLLCLSYLAGGNGATRIRQWRALRNAGAAVLRDGVYLLPDRKEHADFFQAQAQAVRIAGGKAWVLRMSALDKEQEGDLRALFDRSAPYLRFVEMAHRFRAEANAMTAVQRRRGLNRLRRDLGAIEAGDFFPSGEAIKAKEAFVTLASSLEKSAPGEPGAAVGLIEKRDRANYRAQTWVTRARLWVDRVACAWLIRRFIDPRARLLWLKDVRKRPKDSLGFDFDGAEFTHVGSLVSFEVLLASFGLDQDPALVRLGAMVRALDLASPSITPEAQGFATILTGARARCGGDDDRLLEEITPTLNCLYAAFSQGEAGKRPPATLARKRSTRSNS